MKKLLTFLFVMIFGLVSLLAQNPTLSYQSVVRDENNYLVRNTNINLTVQIFEGDVQKYQETRTVTTNQNGVVSFAIGDANRTSNEMELTNITSWNGATIKVTYHLASGDVVVNNPVTAVPYALQAGNAEGISELIERIENLEALSIPIVTTSPITDITATGFTSGVTVQSLTAVTGRGVCYGTTQNPTIDDEIISCGEGVGTQAATINTLSAGMNYFVRAYATNTAGTAYGEQMMFTTLASITINDAADITGFSAISGGTVTTGNANILECGICYNTSGTPTITDNKVIANVATGDFNVSLTDLQPNTTYHMRAYVINNAGVNYSSETKTFTTLQVTPIVVTGTVSNITYKAASCRGEVTSDGGDAITEWGICYSTSENPTIEGNHTQNYYDTPGVGEFSVSLSGLSASTTYYIRAYATNGVGTSYGDQVSFTTAPVQQPNVWWNSDPAITEGNNIQATGVMGDNGGAPITEYGFCYSTTSTTPTISDSKLVTTDINHLAVDFFNASIILEAGTYYIRAYAINSAGIGYSTETKVIATSFTCETSKVMDIDRNIYNTVQIGTQCWTKENARATHYSFKDGGVNQPVDDGAPAELVSHRYLMAYDNNEENIAMYGYLYNWTAATYGGQDLNGDGYVQGVCPDGWHVPANTEWRTLAQYARTNWSCGEGGYPIGRALAAQAGWNYNDNTCSPGYDLSANNISGLSILPAGYCTSANGIYTFGSFGSISDLWGADLDPDNGNPYAIGIFSFTNIVNYVDEHCTMDMATNYGLSVRCVRNE
ncbi:MAG: hypothetical protein IJT04_02470 [Bacteroidales bacterium]|nr:hypothetical protein [Bacteroidales bacterium]